MKALYFIFFSVLSSVLYGQDLHIMEQNNREEDKFIKWVAELPSAEVKEARSFFEKIFNFIVGDDPVIFNNPISVFANGLQDYYVVNQGNGAIIGFQNGKSSTLPLFRKSDSSYPSLVSICTYGEKDFLFSDSRLNRVFHLSNDGRDVSLFNVIDSMNRPTGIAYSAVRGEVWIVETGSHCISVFDRDGKKKRTIGGRGNGPLEFNFPTYIWIDISGKIYIVDSMNFRIQVLSEDGSFITSFGKQGNATGYFARPRGIATDSHGNIYVVDALFNAVQIFDITGKLLYYFGSQGSDKYQFWMPSGIFIDKSDYIYIADSYNGRIQIFQLVKENQK